MNCQKCDKGKTSSAKYYYDEKIGFNTDGIGKFVEQKTDTCPCCGGEWESCQNCTAQQKVTNDLLQQGIAAYKAGKRDEARKFFIAFVKQNPDNESAWGWMYQASNNDQERIHCLKQVLRINPKNEKAKQMLDSLTGQDFPFDPPQPAISTNQVSNIQAFNQMPISKSAPTQSNSLDSISIMIIILLIVLGLFWIAIGLLQISTASLLGESSLDANCSGGWNIMISIVNLLGISDVVKRSKRVPREMLFLAIVGSLLGVFQLINGAVLQACVIPFYIVLGILANVNKAAYTN
jgi:tetratricopeptide (TPR) repeat protein